jgi:hypothetical protein
MTLQVVAIDWSGAASDGGRRKIAAATVVDGHLTLESAERDRDETIGWLVSLAKTNRDLIVGLDFAFSLPMWWLEANGFSDAPSLWRWLRDGHSERLLAECEPPFWGRRGSKKILDSDKLLRATERELLVPGQPSPKSVFQIAGAGAVGTGSLRGMPWLAVLEDSGFSIWPFHAPRLPIVVEIYPRLFTGALAKSNQVRREEYIKANQHVLTAHLHDACIKSEDALDACMSAHGMWKHLDQLLSLPMVQDRQTRLEGRIWFPSRS